MPFTMFQIPYEIREALLNEIVYVIVVLNLKELAQTFLTYGLESRFVRGKIEIATGEKAFDLSPNLIDRLMYECLSVSTICSYLRDVPLSEIKTKKLLDENA